MALKKKNPTVDRKKAKKAAARPTGSGAVRKAAKPPVRQSKVSSAQRKPLKLQKPPKPSSANEKSSRKPAVQTKPVKSAVRVLQAASAKKTADKTPVQTPQKSKAGGRLSSKATSALKHQQAAGVEQPKAEKNSEMEAFCPRCKTETTHKVSVLLGQKIRRVRCTICGTEHNYHRSQLLKMRSVRDELVQAKRRKEEQTESKSLEKMYEEQMIGRDPKLAKGYSIKDKYYIEDLVSHSIFGTGLVTRIKEDGKIEVLFKSGLRLLVHNRFAAAPGKKG